MNGGGPREALSVSWKGTWYGTQIGRLKGGLLKVTYSWLGLRVSLDSDTPSPKREVRREVWLRARL